MSYNNNTPLASERISDTQEPIRLNFSLANTYFGVDHFAFNAASNNGKHRYVTMPDQTATPPSPIASELAFFARTTGGITIPFMVRDGLAAPQYCVLPIRAFGSFTGGGALLNAQNLTSSAFNPGSGYTMTMPAGTVTGTSYGVLVTAGVNGLNPQVAGFYVIANATTFNVGFRNNSGTFLTPDFFTVAVLQV